MPEPEQMIISSVGVQPRIPAAGTVVPSGSLLAPGGDQGVAGVAGVAGPPGPQGYEGNVVGAIMAWPSVTPPAGYLLCDGSAQSRTTYSVLFGVVKTTFGAGDGSTTFNLPDLRSKMIVGYGQGTGLTNRLLAATGGAETVTLAIANLASHTHTVTEAAHAHTGGNHQHLSMSHAHSWSDNNHSNLVAAHSHTLAYGFNSGYSSGGSWYAIGGGSGVVTSTYGQNWATGLNVVCGSVAAYGNAWTDTDAARGGVATSSVAAGVSATSTGSGTPFGIMSPFVVLTYVIRASYNVPLSGSTVPLADTTQPGLLAQCSGRPSDFVGGDNAYHDLASQINALAPIWRGYQCVGNANFEVDSRTVGAGSNFATTAGVGFSQDRWNTAVSTASTARGTFKQTPGQVYVAGSNVCISGYFNRFTLTAQQATLGASDYIHWEQMVEGTRLRALFGGATTAAIVCRSTVAPFSFGFFIRDASSAYSLTHLCSLQNANAWTLFQIPGIPTFTTSGTFNNAPGTVGCTLGVCIAAGSSLTAPANDLWNVGNLIGAYQQGNFGTSPVNSTFDLGLVNFYAGAGFNGLLDQNFDANLRDCERYWQKSNSYGVAPLSASIYQFIGWQPASAPYVRATARFTQHMAKVPTVTLCGSVAGSNQVYLDSSAANVATSTTNQIVLDSGIHQIGLAAASAATAGSCLGGWVADTGW